MADHPRAQHLRCFLQFCGPSLPKGQRQLDCAGVVVTVLAIAQTLALQPEHADLRSARFQVGRRCAGPQVPAACAVAWLRLASLSARHSGRSQVWRPMRIARRSLVPSAWGAASPFLASPRLGRDSVRRSCNACQRITGTPALVAQVSEDHCFINLDAEAACREETVECTTDTAAKRGLAVSLEAWQGWLYCGGRATLCSPQVRALGCLCTLELGRVQHGGRLHPADPCLLHPAEWTALLAGLLTLRLAGACPAAEVMVPLDLH